MSFRSVQLTHAGQAVYVVPVMVTYVKLAEKPDVGNTVLSFVGGDQLTVDETIDVVVKKLSALWTEQQI